MGREGNGVGTSRWEGRAGGLEESTESVERGYVGGRREVGGEKGVNRGFWWAWVCISCPTTG